MLTFSTATLFLYSKLVLSQSQSTAIGTVSTAKPPVFAKQGFSVKLPRITFNDLMSTPTQDHTSYRKILSRICPSSPMSLLNVCQLLLLSLFEGIIYLVLDYFINNYIFTTGFWQSIIWPSVNQLHFSTKTWKYILNICNKAKKFYTRVVQTTSEFLVIRK